jgi:trimethylamine--corrinoid protein Co-methyltransferase
MPVNKLIGEDSLSTFAELLTQEQVERIHDASLEILENVGLLVRNEKARTIFAKHGCTLNSEEHIVRFPRNVVEEFRAMMPSTFTFRGRDPSFDRTLPDQGPVIVTASSAPDILDPVTGQERRARSDDIARIAHLINELPGYDIFSVSTLADDAPPGQSTLSRIYPALKYCLKPIRINNKNLEDAGTILRLGAIIAGSEAAYREHPFITHHFCPVVSPLTMDYESTEMLIYFSENKLPVYPSIVPNAGLTSPMSLTGTLAQGNAEFLAAAVLMQMAQEGTPLIYATLPTVADMRTGAYASGGIECGMLHMGCAQMAHFYNIPCGGYVGLTNAKINDAQSGFETGLSTMGGVLAGMDMLNMGGLLDALKVFDFAKAVIDDEIALMLKRVKRGFEFNEENLALDVIADIGPGGSFMINKHTVRRMKTEALLPRVADRNAREGWEKEGALDTQARAMGRVREILAMDAPALISPDIDAQIRAEFKGLVPGELKLPEGL